MYKRYEDNKRRSVIQRSGMEKRERGGSKMVNSGENESYTCQAQSNGVIEATYNRRYNEQWRLRLSSIC